MLDLVALSCAALAAAFLVAALLNLSSEASWSHVLAKGMFAARSQFTARGWRYRNISVGLAVTAFLIYVALLVVG